jgi:hypothetical protein
VWRGSEKSPPANSNETDPEPDPPLTAVAADSAAGVTEFSRSPEPRAAIESTRRVEVVKVGDSGGARSVASDPTSFFASAASAAS